MANLALVISDFNKEITSKMERNAEKVVTSLDAKIVKKIYVPGAFEMPFAANILLNKKNVDALVVLGAVIQGDTDHDLIIVHNIAQKLMEISLKHNKPIGFGVIGPRVTWQQAQARANEYSKRAVKTALEMTKLKN